MTRADIAAALGDHPGATLQRIGRGVALVIRDGAAWVPVSPVEVLTDAEVHELRLDVAQARALLEERIGGRRGERAVQTALPGVGRALLREWVADELPW